MGLFEKLLGELQKVKTNTMLGPQPFFPNNNLVIKEVQDSLDDLKKERLELNK